MSTPTPVRSFHFAFSPSGRGGPYRMLPEDEVPDRGTGNAHIASIAVALRAFEAPPTLAVRHVAVTPGSTARLIYLAGIPAAGRESRAGHSRTTPCDRLRVSTNTSTSPVFHEGLGPTPSFHASRNGPPFPYLATTVTTWVGASFTPLTHAYQVPPFSYGYRPG